MKCGSCRYAETSEFDEDGEYSRGEYFICRRFPPGPPSNKQVKYTFVHYTDWCGEFRFSFSKFLKK